eukprot:TRINITY_DN4394_c0_g1_i5.p1 TRINITY_DN4394_c0_g1~~TRINITY_DN4394_c0_g1_i5.p1  ORF type:complete len:406 (-),score=86.55 TRINITY_DN4394_c0_g1_i5:1047-2201(-)
MCIRDRNNMSSMPIQNMPNMNKIPPNVNMNNVPSNMNMDMGMMNLSIMPNAMMIMPGQSDQGIPIQLMNHPNNTNNTNNNNINMPMNNMNLNPGNVPPNGYFFNLTQPETAGNLSRGPNDNLNIVEKPVVKDVDQPRRTYFAEKAPKSHARINNVNKIFGETGNQNEEYNSVINITKLLKQAMEKSQGDSSDSISSAEYAKLPLPEQPDLTSSYSPHSSDDVDTPLNITKRRKSSMAMTLDADWTIAERCLMENLKRGKRIFKILTKLRRKDLPYTLKETRIDPTSAAVAAFDAVEGYEAAQRLTENQSDDFVNLDNYTQLLALAQTMNLDSNSNNQIKKDDEINQMLSQLADFENYGLSLDSTNKNSTSTITNVMLLRNSNKG